MASIGKIVSQIINTVGGGRQMPDTELDPRLVRQYVIQAANNYIATAIKNDLNKQDFGISGDFVASFKNVAVTLDEDLNQYYSVVPFSYYDLPLDRGLKQVSAMKDQFTAFTIIRNGDMAIYKNNLAFTEGNYIRCYPEGSKIYYVDDMGGEGRGIDKVLLKVIVNDTSNINDTSEFIPPDMELIVVKECLQLLGIQQAQRLDQISDNYKSS